MPNAPSSDERPLRIGWLFSGYGSLDLAVEHATGDSTVWFSELNEPVARVFSHHRPGVPTSPPSAGVTSSRSVCCAAGSPAMTSRPSARAPALPLAPARAAGRACHHDRSIAIPARGDRERARVAVRPRDPPISTRSNR